MKNSTAENDARPSEHSSKNVGRWEKIRKYALYSVLVLVGVLLLAHLIWHNIGSGEWELAVEKNGVKVWTQKNPGTNLVLIKATTQIEARLASIVKLLEDLDSCADAGCYEANMIQRLETPPGRYGAYVEYKFDMPIPGIGTRHYVLFQEHYQDPETKKLDIELMAAPNKIPRDNCCVRVTHLHNSWEITPRSNGKLDILFKQDTDIGGLMYPLANMGLVEGTYEVLNSLQDLLNKDTYRNAEVDYVDELGVE